MCFLLLWAVTWLKEEIFPSWRRTIWGGKVMLLSSYHLEGKDYVGGWVRQPLEEPGYRYRYPDP